MSRVEPRKSVVEAMRVLVRTLNKEYGWFNEEEIENTPIRVAKFFEEWYNNAKANQMERIKTFETTYDGFVMDTHIPVIGMCSHHMLPIIGEMHIVYIPGKDENGQLKVVGLSKLSRIAKRHMYQPMIQEGFTEKVLNDIVKEINPMWVMVVVKASHDCKRIRGAQDINSEMVTVRIWPNNDKGRELERKAIEYLKLAGVL